MERGTLWAFRVLTVVLVALLLPSTLHVAAMRGADGLNRRGSHAAAEALLRAWLGVVRPGGGTRARQAKLLLADAVKGARADDEEGLEASIEIMRELVEEAPRAPELRLRLGLDLLHAATTGGQARAGGGDPSKAPRPGAPEMLADARAHLAETVALDPSLADARVALGRVMQWQGHLGDAAEELSRVVDADPSHVEARWQLAAATHARGDADQALVHYRHLMDVSGQRHAALYVRVATCLLQRAHRMGRANRGAGRGGSPGTTGELAGHPVASLEDAAGGGDGDGDGDGNAAAVSEAVAMLALAAEADPHSAEVWTLTGRARLFQGAATEAAEALTTARRLAPADPDVAFHLAVALQAAGRCPQAAPLYEEAAASGGLGTVDRRQALFRAGVCYQDGARLERAVELYRAVLGEDDRYAPAHVNWGLALKTAGKLREAEAHYAAALEIDPGFAEAHVKWGNLLYDMAHSEEMRRKVAGVDPDGEGEQGGDPGGESREEVEESGWYSRWEWSGEDAPAGGNRSGGFFGGGGRGRRRSLDGMSEVEAMGELLDQCFAHYGWAAELEPKHPGLSRVASMRKQAADMMVAAQDRADKRAEARLTESERRGRGGG